MPLGSLTPLPDHGFMVFFLLLIAVVLFFSSLYGFASNMQLIMINMYMWRASEKVTAGRFSYYAISYLL